MSVFKIYVDQKDSHVHFRVFSGNKEMGAGLAGKLCMRLEEFNDFIEMLENREVDSMDFNYYRRYEYSAKNPLPQNIMGRKDND